MRVYINGVLQSSKLGRSLLHESRSRRPAYRRVYESNARLKVVGETDFGTRSGQEHIFDQIQDLVETAGDCCVKAQINIGDGKYGGEEWYLQLLSPSPLPEGCLPSVVAYINIVNSVITRAVTKQGYKEIPKMKGLNIHDPKVVRILGALWVVEKPKEIPKDFENFYRRLISDFNPDILFSMQHTMGWSIYADWKITLSYRGKRREFHIANSRMDGYVLVASSIMEKEPRFKTLDLTDPLVADHVEGLLESFVNEVDDSIARYTLDLQWYDWMRSEATKLLLSYSKAYFLSFKVPHGLENYGLTYEAKLQQGKYKTSIPIKFRFESPQSVRTGGISTSSDWKVFKCIITLGDNSLIKNPEPMTSLRDIGDFIETNGYNSYSYYDNPRFDPSSDYYHD